MIVHPDFVIDFKQNLWTIRKTEKSIINVLFHL